MGPILETYTGKISHFFDEHIIRVKGVSGCADGSPVAVYLCKMDASSELRLFFEDSQLRSVWPVVVVH